MEFRFKILDGGGVVENCVILDDWIICGFVVADGWLEIWNTGLWALMFKKKNSESGAVVSLTGGFDSIRFDSAFRGSGIVTSLATVHGSISVLVHGPILISESKNRFWSCSDLVPRLELNQRHVYAKIYIMNKVSIGYWKAKKKQKLKNYRKL